LSLGAASRRRWCCWCSAALSLGATSRRRWCCWCCWCSAASLLAARWLCRLLSIRAWLARLLLLPARAQRQRGNHCQQRQTQCQQLLHVNLL
jgi:hypothetical protein